jgi:hypothetical protein
MARLDVEIEPDRGTESALGGPVGTVGPIDFRWLFGRGEPGGRDQFLVPRRVARTRPAMTVVKPMQLARIQFYCGTSLKMTGGCPPDIPCPARSGPCDPLPMRMIRGTRHESLYSWPASHHSTVEWVSGQGFSCTEEARGPRGGHGEERRVIRRSGAPECRRVPVRGTRRRCKMVPAAPDRCAGAPRSPTQACVPQFPMAWFGESPWPFVALRRSS